MVDEGLKSKLLAKLKDGSMTSVDIPEYMNLFCQICNESEEVQEEIEGWTRLFQFIINGADNLWLKIDEGGKFSEGPGKADKDPDITLEMDADTATGIFSGEIDATSAYMNNELKVIGPLPDAVKFRTLTELVRDSIEE